MYVDADFCLALLKPKDWLKAAAHQVARDYAGQLETSESTLLELLVVLGRFDIDLPSALAELDLVAPFTDAAVAALAARNMQRFGMTPFDAVLAARAERDHQAVVSSDADLEKPGVRRVPLR